MSRKKEKVCLEGGQIENIVNAGIAIREGREEEDGVCPTAVEFLRENYDIERKNGLKEKEDKQTEKKIKKWVDKVDKKLESQAKDMIEKFASYF